MFNQRKWKTSIFIVARGGISIDYHVPCHATFKLDILSFFQVAKACTNDREAGEARWGRFFLRGKLSEVEHIASVVAFLASQDAIYINATDIMIDDGYLAMGPEQQGQWSSFAGNIKS